MNKAEKIAKSAEQAIIGEEKVVKTASSLVKNIKIAGESPAEKTEFIKLEQAEQLQEEAGKTIDQQTLERESKDMKSAMEENDTEDEKEEDSSPEAAQIIGESQKDKAAVQHEHHIKVDDSKTEEQVAIEKAANKVKKSVAKDADNKLVAAAEKKEVKIAQKEISKVSIKAQK